MAWLAMSLRKLVVAMRFWHHDREREFTGISALEGVIFVLLLLATWAFGQKGYQDHICFQGRSSETKGIMATNENRTKMGFMYGAHR